MHKLFYYSYKFTEYWSFAGYGLTITRKGKTPIIIRDKEKNRRNNNKSNDNRNNTNNTSNSNA